MTINVISTTIKQRQQRISTLTQRRSNSDSFFDDRRESQRQSNSDSFFNRRESQRQSRTTSSTTKITSILTADELCKYQRRSPAANSALLKMIEHDCHAKKGSLERRDRLLKKHRQSKMMDEKKISVTPISAARLCTKHR